MTGNLENRHFNPELDPENKACRRGFLVMHPVHKWLWYSYFIAALVGIVVSTALGGLVLGMIAVILALAPFYIWFAFGDVF